MPNSADLVTDLPADFEVFGQAVATSMGDLLGGTTGQILSKASATDNIAFKNETIMRWKEREANCSDKQCILNWYAARKIELSKWLSTANPNPELKVKSVTAIYTSLGVKEETEALVKKYFDEAFVQMSALNIGDEKKVGLLKFMSGLVDREV
jgi:geranylgeranyl pyrophosphate synthase